MKKIALIVVALSTLAACGNNDMASQPMAEQPMVIVAEPTMNKL